MLHSGSRNIGKEIAERHIATAKTLHRLNELPDPNLAYFIQGTDEFKNYWRDLEWAQGYAMMNRLVMMKRLLKSFNRMFNKQKEFRPEIEVNCHHNYVAAEEHFGEKVFVTRKGAINAEEGRYGIIPGSMGAKSFIIKGRGNPESYNSCSHGAGRKMSRTAAKKRFTREDLERMTKGVECRKDAGVIDEIPGAYKNSLAFERVLPVLLARQRLIYVRGSAGGEDSAATSGVEPEQTFSGGFSRETSQRNYAFPNYGVVPENGRDIFQPQGVSDRIAKWLRHVQLEIGDQPSLIDLPPTAQSDSNGQVEWEKLAEPDTDGFAWSVHSEDQKSRTSSSRHDFSGDSKDDRDIDDSPSESGNSELQYELSSGNEDDYRVEIST